MATRSCGAAGCAATPAASAASSAVAPKRSRRPPNAIAQIAEPGRAERQPGDHVAQPVHAEQHAAAGHRHGEPGRDPGDRGPLAAVRARG